MCVWGRQFLYVIDESNNVSLTIDDGKETNIKLKTKINNIIIFNMTKNIFCLQ